MGCNGPGTSALSSLQSKIEVKLIVPQNGGHCQPILFEHPHDPSIGHFELANFHTLENIISSKGIDCEFAVQPGVRAIYDSGHLTDVELAFLTCQETAPEIAEMMRLVTKKDELEKLRIPTAIGAVVTSVAARMWPYKFVSRVLEDLLTSTELVGSFNLQTLTPVECIAPYYGDRWTVKTSRGCIVANKVVLATNAYTSHLLPEFADLIVPCRGQMSALVPLPSLSGDMRLKTSLGFMGEGVDDYLIQRPNERGGHLMFGGGRQHGPSMGTTDDSVLDEKTAQYLRTRLVDAFALPEGKATSSEPCDYCRRRRVRKARCDCVDRLVALRSPLLTLHYRSVAADLLAVWDHARPVSASASQPAQAENRECPETKSRWSLQQPASGRASWVSPATSIHGSVPYPTKQACTWPQATPVTACQTRGSAGNSLLCFFKKAPPSMLPKKSGGRGRILSPANALRMRCGWKTLKPRTGRRWREAGGGWRLIARIRGTLDDSR